MSEVTVTAAASLTFVQAPGRLRADPLAGLGATESVRVVRLDAAGTKYAHYHPFSAEIMYVVAGEGHVVSGDERTAVAPGDVIYAPRDVPHGILPRGHGEMVLVCFFAHPDLDQNTVEAGEIS